MLTPLRSAVAILLALASAAAAQVEFHAVSNVITTTPGESVGHVWGDLDGDGDPDLFVARGNGAAFNAAFRNDGGDSFSAWPAANLGNDAGNSTAACVADIDADGDLDLFVAQRANENELLYVNDGGLQGGVEGVFQKDAASVAANDAGDSRACLSFDSDGDADADLFVANASGQHDALYVNQGGAQAGVPGAFVKLIGDPLVSDGDPTYGADVADVDGDGDLDIFAANGNGETSNLYLNNAGTFVRVIGQHPVLLAGPSRAAAFGDLDADGDQDLVVGNLLANNFLYLNSGGVQGGTPGDFTQVTAGLAANDGSATLGVDLGDFDGDDDLDLFVANCCGFDNLLYANDGAGAQFSAVTAGPFVGAGGYSNSASFADYDGDLDLDLYVANGTWAGSNLDFLYRNEPTAPFVKLTTGPLANDVNKPFALVAADADADGDLDLFVPNSNGLDEAYFVNQGGGQGGVEGEFVEQTGTPITTGTGGDSWAADLGDMDGDGDLDLIVANRLGENEALFRNQGGAQGGAIGSFAALVLAPVTTSGGSSRDATWVDWDGDADLDLLLVNSDNEVNFVFRNNGGAQFGTEGTFTGIGGTLATDLGDKYDAAWGDMDVDGDLDLYVANRAGDDFLYVNAGGLQGGLEGVFAKELSGPVVTSGGVTFAGAWADMDADGDLDLFAANSGGTNALFRNLGGAQGGTVGTFETLASGPVGSDTALSRRAAWGDYDGDDLPDLFVPNVLGADDYLYRNLGDGQFAHAGGAVEGDGGNSRAGVFADLDGDLDLDLVVARHGEPLATFVNAGPLQPTPWVDLGQGKPGVAGIPQLEPTGSLVAGTPVAQQVTQAAPGAALTLVLGLTTIYAPFKGGVIVPAPDLVLTGFVTDGAGELLLVGTWPAGVPAAFTIYLQAFVTDLAAVKGLAHSNAVSGTTP